MRRKKIHEHILASTVVLGFSYAMAIAPKRVIEREITQPVPKKWNFSPVNS
jgi:hypothetical protein